MRRIVSISTVIRGSWAISRFLPRAKHVCLAEATLGVAFRANAVIGPARSRRAIDKEVAVSVSPRSQRAPEPERADAAVSSGHAREAALCKAGGFAGYRLGMRLALPLAVLVALA